MTTATTAPASILERKRQAIAKARQVMQQRRAESPSESPGERVADRPIRPEECYSFSFVAKHFKIGRAKLIQWTKDGMLYGSDGVQKFVLGKVLIEWIHRPSKKPGRK